MRRVPIKELGISLEGISHAAMNVAQQLHDHDYKAYLVGGAVRDLLLGHAPKDFDIATNARPEQIKKIFRRSWIIGKRFRLVHVRIKNQLIEVSTFRKAPKSPSRKGNGLVTDDNTYGSIKEDAYRRDITMNSLFLDPLEKCVYDYTGGLVDLQSRKLRIIGKPEVRYREDPVRMIRIIRLAAKLDCDIEAASLKPIVKLADLLDGVAKPRLFEEIVKVIFSKASCKGFKLLQQHNLLNQLFPHVARFNKAQQDFWETSLNNTDRLNRNNNRVSLTYVLSALFWSAIAQKWKEATESGNDNMHLMNELFKASGIEQNLILSRVVRGKIWEIWEHQARFQRLYHKRKALSLRSSYASGKALNFLRLRNETGEIDETLPDWWEEFMTAGKEEREAMVPKKIKKRRQGKHATKTTTQDPGN